MPPTHGTAILPVYSSRGADLAAPHDSIRLFLSLPMSVLAPAPAQPGGAAEVGAAVVDCPASPSVAVGGFAVSPCVVGAAVVVSSYRWPGSSAVGAAEEGGCAPLGALHHRSGL